MNDIQKAIARLQDNDWTLAAIAEEIGVQWLTVHRWKTGQTYPPIAKPVLRNLEAMLRRKRVPGRRRYSKRGRLRAAQENQKPTPAQVRAMMEAQVDGLRQGHADGDS